jgi:hypothetical protein
MERSSASSRIKEDWHLQFDHLETVMMSLVDGPTKWNTRTSAMIAAEGSALAL